MTDFKIYVAAHRPFDYLQKIKDIPGYIPIQGGKDIYDANRYDNRYSYLPEMGDNTGDNISWKNEYYCELTVLYWIWKNDKSKPDDIVGLTHYRRYFGDKVYKFLSKEYAANILSRYDYIVYGAGIELQDYYFDKVKCDDDSVSEYSVYKGYRECHNISDMDCALRGIKILFPELYETMNYQIRQNGAMSICNMMVTHKKLLDEYCEFLFTLYDWMEKELDFQKIFEEKSNGRFFGYLSERLQRPWMVATNKTAYSGVELNFEAISGYVWY